MIKLNRGAAAQPTASVAGTVVSETGEPLVAATVEFTRFFGSALIKFLSEEESGAESPRVLTNASGGFSVQGVEAGTYDLSVRIPGYMPWRFAARSDSERSTGLTLVSGERLENIKVVLQRSARIEGYVRSEAGMPSAGIPLQLFYPESLNFVAQARSAEDGSYRLDSFSPGTYILVAGFPIALNGEPGRSLATEIRVPNTEVRKLDLTLEARDGFGIRGKVNIAGESVPPADVSMTAQVASVGGTPPTARTGVNISYSYDARSGDFEIPGLFPGIYTIRATTTDAQNLAKCATGIVVVADADVAGRELTLGSCTR